MRENRLCTGLNRADGSWLLLFFFLWSAVYPLCFAPIRSSCKSVTTEKRILGFSFLLLALTRMNDSTIFVGILYRIYGFLDKRRFSIWWTSFVNITYGLLRVSLSIKTYPSTRTISLLSCPRVVNHDTRGKSQKHNEGWLFI